MDHSEEEIRDAIKTQNLLCQKLLEILNLQGYIDSLLRDNHPPPFGSEKFKNARPEELQRLVMTTAIQFVLFEPEESAKGNGDFKKAAENLFEVTASQLNWLKEKYYTPKDDKK